MYILLVDDNPMMQQVMLRFLKGLGYEVGIAGSAREAVALARQSPPALILIDLYLPDTDGPEALQELRTLPGCAEVPAIAISGMNREDAHGVEEAGFSEFLTKPVDLDDLAKTVFRYMPPPPVE
ncbi:MAG TPA: response regulator [Roseiflexaceae bacterium]|nr:response regulator [Roseiflexaceae bacterium]